MTIDPKKRYLMIVESPNKVATIRDIFKQLNYKNIIVMASVGHITEIKNSGVYNMGIDPKNDFKADYAVTEGKQEVVSKLKEQVKMADEVIIATDGDREGEDIGYHLKTVLKIADKKYIRIVYHEITKNAIQKAIENGRALDLDLVSACEARKKADKIIGYRVSGITRANVGGKSAGRCQSAGLKLIAEREEEIRNFKVETFFDFLLHFTKNASSFKAKYVGTDKQEIKQLKSLSECKAIADACKGNPYIIKDIETKELKENPKLPFCTSTFQQEVSKQLGISVKDAMDCAQKLFEGIEIGGKHIALITYLRTDDTEFAPEFLPILKDYVINNYGKKYYAPVRKGKKSENAQEGHEAIRPVDLEMTPEKLSSYISNERLLKVYTIIYKRTIAAGMASAVISNTEYSIYNKDNKFIMNSRELLFDGYRKVYSYTEESKDDSELVNETFAKGEELLDTRLEAVERKTNPPKRFNEASFIKELDKKGIGRPSTYATILGTLLDPKRNYCKVEGKEIVPTDLGMNVSKFLDKSFPDIFNIEYTSELEKELDEIANGKRDGIDFLTEFYSKLETSINKVQPDVSDRKCPECGSPLVIRKGKFGPFLGCSNYPKCKHIEKLSK